jgi:hypothetical protein
VVDANPEQINKPTRDVLTKKDLNMSPLI